MSKVVQESIGQAVIESVASFARADLESVEILEQDKFSHVTDAVLRKTLAETYFGARWVYKLGLVFLVRDEEQMAHVRTQIVDYGAVCEGLLSDCLFHGLERNILSGEKCRKGSNNRDINWRVGNVLNKLRRQNFYWHIEVAFEEQIIDLKLQEKLHKLRKLRNTVHLGKRSRTPKAFITTSKNAFETVVATINQTKFWRDRNP